MLWSSFLLLLVLQTVNATPTPSRLYPRLNDGNSAWRESSKAFAPATELRTSDKIVKLRHVGKSPKSSKALASVRASGITTLNPVEGGAGYGAEVQLGGQSFTLLFDTGSSDLWVAETGIECVNANGRRVPVRRCDFGPRFSGKFEEGQVPRQNFFIAYGDGEFLTGNLGYEDVTVAGVTVNHQEIASVDLGYFVGDGVISGVLGFAFSTLTSAYLGNDPANDNPQTNGVHYTNFLGNAIKQGKISPMFSLALERGANGGSGQLALGGLPTIPFNHDFTSVPLRIVEFSPRRSIEATKYTYYTINLDGIVVNGQPGQMGIPVIVDSGTALTYIPPTEARVINTAFDPPSKLVNGLWENDCNAKPPKFSFGIGGANFEINPTELLVPKPLGYDPATGGCICGIQPIAQQPYILGETFLKNVVAVYDIGAKEMRFAPHVNY